MTSEQRSLTSVDVAPLGLRRAAAVLIVVMIADVMDLLDSTIANLAGPSIRADLGGSETTLQWVLAAYTVTFAIGLVTSGRLGDLLGRRRLFLAGMAGFTLASLACGLAPSATFLIIARAVQGLAGSVMIPQGLALIRVVFPPEQLRKALIPFGPIMGLATVAGPILAGWLLALDLFGTQWRAIFLINVPIGIASAANQNYLSVLGAEPVIYGEEMVERVRALAPGGVDVALDVAGSGVLPQLIDLAGDSKNVVTLADTKGSTEHGVRFSNGFVDGHAFHALAEVGELIEAGRFWLPVDRTFPLAEIAEAHRISEHGHVRGRLVLVIG